LVQDGKYGRGPFGAFGGSFIPRQMSKVRFHAGDIDLELSGSEPFVLRQLKLLGAFLGPVDASALSDPQGAPTPAPTSPVEPPVALGAVAEALPSPPALLEAAPAPEPPRPTNGEGDELLEFYRGFEPQGLDRQSDAALLFAYYLQRHEGQPSLEIKDLIRCCIRAGVDTRNFNRTLGTLTRRGFLEAARQGTGYRLSDQGVAAVESRL
jgi:hypothetical protein